MKKIVMMLALMLAVCGGAMAQDVSSKQNTKEETKEIRELTRQERKLLQQAIDSTQWAEALQAIGDSTFTLEADQVIFKYGQRAYVSSTTNFVRVDKANATVQVAFNIPVAGPNGMGGVTLDGRVTDYKITTDKKGTMTTLAMNVMGVGISSRLTISIYKGSNHARVDVLPNFNSHRISLSGRLLPNSQSYIVKGSAL